MRRLLALALALAMLAFAPLVAAKQGDVEIYTAFSTGQITIDQEGRVADARLDNTLLGKEIIQGYLGQISSWQFKPILVDGKPAQVTAHMNLSLVAFRQEGVDGLRLGMDKVSFSDLSSAGEELGQMRPESRVVQPTFPDQALDAGIGAYLVLRVKLGKDGAVADVATQDAWLLGEMMGSRVNKKKFARQFARAAESAVRQWRYPNAPEGWQVLVPVRFGFGEAGKGQRWLRSHPVPMEVPAWVSRAADNVVIPTAYPGQAYSDRFQLLTRLDDGMVPASDS